MLFFFPWDVLDDIFDLIQSVCEGFPTYSYMCMTMIFASLNDKGPFASTNFLNNLESRLMA